MKRFLSLSVLMVLISCGSSTTSQTPSSSPSATTLAEEISPTTTLEVEQPSAEEQEITEDEHTHEHSIEIASHYLEDYSISDFTFGTETTVTVTNGLRTITTNALPDHETGEFPNSGNPNTISAQSSTYQYTTNPINTGTAKEIHVPGVAVNGVKFEPGTAETVDCVTGETYRVEGLQETFNLGMDFNNAHVQPTGAYHYHGLSELLAETHNESTSELVHVGFAADGHLMYISTADTYISSYQLSTILRTGNDCVLSLGARDVVMKGTTPDGTYTSDWEYVAGSGNLDECNGVSINGEYVYIITNDFPYISRCLKGEFSESRPNEILNDQETDQGQGHPDLNKAAAILDVTVEQLAAALGPPPPDLENAALILGVSMQELRDALTQ